MQQREIFVLKMILSQDETEKEFRAVLQSARNQNQIQFNSIEKLTEYLKIWEIRAIRENENNESFGTSVDPID